MSAISEFVDKVIDGENTIPIRDSGAREEISGIKETLSSLHVEETVVVAWEQGTVGIDGGVLQGSDTRIRTPLRNYRGGIKITVPEGMNVATRVYNASGTYEGWTNWSGGTIEIALAEEKGYRFVARYTDDRAIVPSAGAGITIQEIVSAIEVMGGSLYLVGRKINFNSDGSVTWG